MRDSVDGARPSFSATSSSLSEWASRRRRSSAPRRRRRTVGPRGTRSSPPHEAEGSAVRNFAENRCDPIRTPERNRQTPHPPDRQYDTALSPQMKSHPGFQQGNFLHALAPCGLAAPASVLVLAHVIDHEGANRGQITERELKRCSAQIETI